MHLLALGAFWRYTESAVAFDTRDVLMHLLALVLSDSSLTCQDTANVFAAS